MAQNWWRQGFLRNSFLKLGTYFGHWEWHVDGPALMFTSVPSSDMKKKLNSFAFQQVKEAIAARIMRIVYIKSDENIIDILKKP
jgi:hypothetical protein